MSSRYAPPGGKLPQSVEPQPPVKIVKVRAHTRAIQPKPAPIQPHETLGQARTRMLAEGWSPEQVKGQIKRWHAKRAVSKPAPVNTQRLEPAAKTYHATSLKPYFPGQKPSGWQPAGPGRGVPLYTFGHGTSGPVGQESTRWNAAQVAAAHNMQVQNYGRAGYALRSALPGGLDEGGTSSVARAALRAANAASMALPGGGVGEAGILGLAGLGKLRGAVRGARALKDVAETAPAAAHVAEEAAVVRGGMRGAKVLRGKQEAGYSAERSKRVAAARVHLDNPNLAPNERIRLAKRELAGELPKINFQGFNELNDQSLKALQTHILEHPHLLPFQKIRASDALTGALAGKVPTRSEITLLEHVFGKDTAAGLGAIAQHPFKDTLLSVLNVPRSLMASFDLSAPFRQGLMVSTRHPKIFARNFGSMVKAFGSEKVYSAALDEIKARPTYPLMMEAKLSLTDLGRAVGEREEQFASNIAEKIPAAGRGVRASGRAYTGFLDKTRADVFDHLIQRAQTQGINVQDQKFLKDLGRYVNTATGRGPLGNLQGAAPALNAVFFSPRLMASRLDAIFSPLTYAKADPFVRKEAIRSMLQLAGTASTLLALASQIPGAKVGTDPRSADWGKIRLGNTRLDIGGGFQQYLRLFAQIGTGIAISSTTGKRLSLTAGQFGKPTRLDLLLRFFEGKESPIASLATDYLRNSNQIGEKFSLKKEAVQRVIPLLAQDSYDLYNEKHGGMNGLAAAFAGYAVGSVGFGMQTYGPKPTKSSGPPDYAGGPGGGSPYAPPSGGGSPYAPP